MGNNSDKEATRTATQAEKFILGRMILPVVFLFTQLVCLSNAQMLTLDRDVLDTIHDVRCWSMHRTTGTSTDCTCKPEYGTVMAPAGETWGCATPAEAGCKYALGEAGKVYPITKHWDSVAIVPDISISAISSVAIYNFRSEKGGILDKTFWEDITKEASRCFNVEDGGKKLTFEGLDLSAWSGHVIKIGLGTGTTCAFAKLAGHAEYPLELDAFKGKNLCTGRTTPRTPTKRTTPPTKRTTKAPPTPPEHLPVARDVRDTMRSNKCSRKSRTTVSSTGCTCKEQYSTAMSAQGNEWDCYTPKEVGCKYSVYAGNNAHLIRETDSFLDISPTIKGEHRYVKNVLLWSAAMNGQGSWIDVTTDTKSFFNLDAHAHALKVTGLELEKWKGNVVKVVLGDGECLVLKVPGSVVYPLDADAFKKSVRTTTTSTKSTTEEVDSSTETSSKVVNGVKVTTTTVTTVEVTTKTGVDTTVERSPVNDEL